MRRQRNGVVLLEVLCAGLLLSVAGVSIARSMAMQVRAMREVIAQDATVEARDRVLSAMSLLAPGELRAYQPAANVGEFRVRVTDIAEHLFEITIESREGSSRPMSTLVAVP